MMSGADVSSPNTTKTNGNSNINQKKGAERLFQYMEADDSDPEDYARYVYLLKAMQQKLRYRKYR